MSLRTRLLLGLAVLVLSAVASTGWLVLSVARARLAGAQEADARLVAASVAHLLRLSYDPQLPLADARNRASLSSAARAAIERGDARELVIVDGRGTPIFGDAHGDGALAAASTGAPLLRHAGSSILVYAALTGPSGPVGALRVRTPGDDALGAALGDARLLLLAVTMVDGGLVLLFGALFIRRVVGPLEALQKNARRVAAGELDVPPVESRGDDELGRLTEAFNRMTASLRQQRDTLVAQEKLATVGRLAAGVAHEFGNPLQAVLGYADLLLRDEPAPAPDAPINDRRDMLERIRRETERIRGIVADLLDYSRPVAGAAEPVRLAECVDVALSLLRPQARFRDVAVETRLAPDLPPAAASSSRVVQVLVNLLLNAADAMGGTGRITVEARALERENAVELSVADSGPGVPAADRARIFDPFFTT
ncbi:MAG TPA: HAMP domain-containing sensor histidine kinase, partial [Polyangia bacterium]|nr:HAMP domain-containing sensor histidine kinase [Polyangia bacterium]